MAKWLWSACSACGGHGIREAFGGGPTECYACKGGHGFFVSPKDRLADYPGGPLRGSAPGLYAELLAERATSAGTRQGSVPTLGDRALSQIAQGE